MGQNIPDVLTINQPTLARELELRERSRITEDAREGRLSFHEKRAPVYKGR